MFDDLPPETISRRPPTLRRPRSGWLAWEATLGYISNHISPDAILRVEMYPASESIADESLHWSARVSWANIKEEVRDKATLGEALSELWQSVRTEHTIFKDAYAAMRQPANYKDDQWLDERSQITLERVTRIIRSVLKQKKDWRFIMIYQPISNSDVRVQVRLIAPEEKVHIGGHGPALHQACLDLHHNVASKYIYGDDKE